MSTRKEEAPAMVYFASLSKPFQVKHLSDGRAEEGKQIVVKPCQHYCQI
jgi:hypothetical protein